MRANVCWGFETQIATWLKSCPVLPLCLCRSGWWLVVASDRSTNAYPQYLVYLSKSSVAINIIHTSRYMVAMCECGSLAQTTTTLSHSCAHFKFIYLLVCVCVCMLCIVDKVCVCVCLWTSSHVVRSKHKAYAAKHTHFAGALCAVLCSCATNWYCTGGGVYGVYCVRTRSRWRLISAATTTTAAARRGWRRGCNKIFAQYCANMRRVRLIPRDAVVCNIIIFCANLVAVTDATQVVLKTT